MAGSCSAFQPPASPFPPPNPSCLDCSNKRSTLNMEKEIFALLYTVLFFGQPTHHPGWETTSLIGHNEIYFEWQQCTSDWINRVTDDSSHPPLTWKPHKGPSAEALTLHIYNFNFWSASWQVPFKKCLGVFGLVWLFLLSTIKHQALKQVVYLLQQY